MADYKEKFDDLHRAAKRKAREIDEKLGVKGIVEDTARVAGDAAKLGAKTIADGAGQLRAEAERFADDNNLRETAGRAAGEKAAVVFYDAKSYVSTAAKVAGKSVRATRAGAAATAGILKAKDWVK